MANISAIFFLSGLLFCIFQFFHVRLTCPIGSRLPSLGKFGNFPDHTGLQWYRRIREASICNRLLEVLHNRRNLEFCMLCKLLGLLLFLFWLKDNSLHSTDPEYGS